MMAWDCGSRAREYDAAGGVALRQTSWSALCGRSEVSTIIPGVYQLRIRLREPKVVRVGALGRCRLDRGWYVYTGSARGGLPQRLRRHLRRDKRLYWHIDYLLAAADRVDAFVLPGLNVSECELHVSHSPGDGFSLHDLG